MQREKRKPKADANAMIQTALDINTDDLATNDAGRLSAHQRQRIWWAYAPWLAVGVIALAGLILAALMTAPPPWLLFAVLLLGLGFVVEAPKLLAVLRDTARQQVEVIEGRIQQDIDDNVWSMNWKPKYRLRVNDETFTVNKQTFLAFRNNEPYRLYYTPRTRTLVGAEWMQSHPFIETDADAGSAPDRLRDTADDSAGDDTLWQTGDEAEARTRHSP